MKRVTTVLTFLILTNSAFAQLWIVDPLKPIYPDKNKLKAYNNKWGEDIPKGSMAEAHVILQLPKDTQFTISARKDGNVLKGVWSQLIDVPVEQNTGIDSRTEQYLNKPNPYVVRRAPFKIFEVIQPLRENQLTTLTNYTALRLEIPPSAIQNIGKHHIKIEVKTNSKIYKGDFTIKVHPVDLPKLSESNFFYTNWFNLKNMEEKHQLKRWSDTWFSMLEKYADLMAHGRQNSITIPHELIKYESERFFLDEEKMLRFINVF